MARPCAYRQIGQLLRKGGLDSKLEDGCHITCNGRLLAVGRAELLQTYFKRPSGRSDFEAVMAV